MKNLETIFEELYNSINNKQNKVELSKSLRSKADSDYVALESDRSMIEGVDSLGRLSTVPQEEYLLQEQIRPHFGKDGINETAIGTHPNFISLEESNETQGHYTCTLFVDIKGSTRLSLLYPLEQVFKFKNAVIRACVDVIRAFDGHVHRLMGDAVMAFFSGDNSYKENSIADAINCSITLRAILEESIKPWMESEGFEAKDFGFRIGCDFGNDEEVLWGKFGYKNVGEVSATGLPVDMASKLQGLAGKNQAMLGQGLMEFVNWPEHYSKVKIKESNGEKNELAVVTPNITDGEGKPLNYSMRQLNYSKSIEFSALPREFRDKISKGAVKHHPDLEYRCFTVIDDSKNEYISASKFLDKNISLLFKVEASTRGRLSFPLKVSFYKTNHGKEVPEEEMGVEQEIITKRIYKKPKNSFNKTIPMFLSVTLDEYTSYRGLHTMKCEVFDSNETLLFRDWIGVLIK